MVLDAADAQSGRIGPEIHRVVLEHHECVEQLSEPDRSLDFSKTYILVDHEAGLHFLQSCQHLYQRCSRAYAHANGERIDKQPNHALSAENVRGPAGDSGTEHHILAPGHPAQQDTPRTLQYRVQGQTMSTSRAGQ